MEKAKINFIKEQMKLNMKYVGKIPRKKKKKLTTYLWQSIMEYSGFFKEIDKIFIAPYILNPKYRK